MYTVILAIDICLALFLCILVMLQRPEGGALGGLGGGTGSSFMTGRSVGNTLTKMTAIVAALFFATSLTLGVLAKKESKPVNVLENAVAQASASAQSQNAPVDAPEAPEK